MRLGWRFSDPELLNAVGSVSGQSVPGIALGLIPTLEGLHYRLALPSATFLDIGC